MNEFEINISHKSLKRICQIQGLYGRKIIKHLKFLNKDESKQIRNEKRMRKGNQSSKIRGVFNEVRKSYSSLLAHWVLWLGMSSSFTMANTCPSTSSLPSRSNKHTSTQNLQSSLWVVRGFSKKLSLSK